MALRTSQWKKDAKVASLVKKLDKVIEDYKIGAASKKDYDKTLAELNKACEKAGTINLDFHDFASMAAKREANFKKFTANAALDHLDKTTWKLIKKEAGIKKSGFLKKSDANVGKFIDKYRKSYSQWGGSRIKTAVGDHKMLERATKDAEALLDALKKFVAAKEFRSELAQDLQRKCEDFIKALTSDIAEMKKLRTEAQDTSMFTRALKENFPGF